MILPSLAAASLCCRWLPLPRRGKGKPLPLAAAAAMRQALSLGDAQYSRGLYLMWGAVFEELLKRA